MKGFSVVPLELVHVIINMRIPRLSGYNWQFGVVTCSGQTKSSIRGLKRETLLRVNACLKERTKSGSGKENGLTISSPIVRVGLIIWKKKYREKMCLRAYVWHVSNEL